MPEDYTNAPEAGSPLGGLSATISSFDWLKLPGAARAIARVVIGAGEAVSSWTDVITAKGEQAAQTIRDTTHARSRALTAMTEAAIRNAKKDPALVTRAIHYLVDEQISKQENREAVAAEAVRVLEEFPSNPATPSPDDDWLNIFIAQAEKASSDRARKHWARILAGEIKNPGSFSLMTINLLAVIDQRLAQIIEQARGWIVQDDHIAITKSFRKGDLYSKLLALDAIGFLRMGSAKFIPAPKGQVIYYVGNRTIFYSCDREITYHAAILTLAGRELIKIIPAVTDDTIVAEAVELMVSRGATALPRP